MTTRARWLVTVMALPAAVGCAAVIAAAQPAASPAASRFELPPMESLQATRERPLFSPARRPPAVVAAPEGPMPITESASLPFELTGIALGGDERIAILHNKTTNEELRLREGDKVSAWELEAVAERFILLRGDGHRVRVWLFDNEKKPGIEVHQVDGEAESTATVIPPGAGIDQEVMPSASPAVRTPGVPVPAPVLKRVPRPPAAARVVPMVRPEARRRIQRN